ncbi:MAG: hypothetical protein JSS65_04330 [Armatimonadetes bacterium]|nr:hypothetical protein [Armatimonadota bacterium]
MRQTLCAALLFAGLAGCGGSSGGPSANSPFAGHWVGNYTSDISQTGTANLTVANDGSVTGTGHNTTANFNFDVAGSVQDNGHLTGDFSGGMTAQIDGNVAVDNNGHLSGTVHQMNGSATVTLQIDLTPLWP